MDQLTRLVEPAHFVDAITIHKGDALVLDSQMTFSLSANPSLQFSVADDAFGPLSAAVHDNKDNQFEQAWQQDASGQNSQNGKSS
jgi:sulfur-oxidizing protein SoxY